MSLQVFLCFFCAQQKRSVFEEGLVTLPSWSVVPDLIFFILLADVLFNVGDWWFPKDSVFLFGESGFWDHVIAKFEHHLPLSQSLDLLFPELKAFTIPFCASCPGAAHSVYNGGTCDPVGEKSFVISSANRIPCDGQPALINVVTWTAAYSGLWWLAMSNVCAALVASLFLPALPWEMSLFPEDVPCQQKIQLVRMKRIFFLWWRCHQALRSTTSSQLFTFWTMPAKQTTPSLRQGWVVFSPGGTRVRRLCRTNHMEYENFPPLSEWIDQPSN